MALLIADYSFPADVHDYASRGGSKGKATKKAIQSNAQRDKVRAEMALNKIPVDRWDIKKDIWVVPTQVVYDVLVDWAARKNMCMNEAGVYLASEMGCHEDVIVRMTRKQWKPFGFVDVFFQVLGREDLTSQVQVYANPHIKKNQWVLLAQAEGVEDPELAWAIHSPEKAA